MEMEYRRLGGSGLKVSVLSFGSWVTFGPQLAGTLAEDCLGAAYDAGVNFFDNAEAYSAGESERIMGDAIAALGWPRHTYVLSTKLFWGIHSGRQSWRHPQPQVPPAGARRVARAARSRLRGPRLLPPSRSRDPDRRGRVGVSDLISSGKALYWGISEWPAERHPGGLSTSPTGTTCAAGRRATRVQPRVAAARVEKEYAPLYDGRRSRPHHLESRLPPGLLSGKYLDGVPEGSRATLPRLRVAGQHAHRQGAQREGP